MLQFSGTVGDWSKKLTCEDGNWATGIDVKYAIDRLTDNLGIVQMRLKCNNRRGDAETFDGKIFPLGHPKIKGVFVSPISGPLETENPEQWEYGVKTASDLGLWQSVKSGTGFIRGVRVKTDQDIDFGIGTQERMFVDVTADMVGINDIKFAVRPYGR